MISSGRSEPTVVIKLLPSPWKKKERAHGSFQRSWASCDNLFCRLSKNDSATLKLMPRWALHDRTHACSVRLRYTWLRRPILLGGARRTATVESTPLLSITALTLGFITVYITCTTVASRVAANACDTHLRFLTEPLLLPCHARVTRNPYAVTSLRRYGLIAF